MKSGSHSTQQPRVFKMPLRARGITSKPTAQKAPVHSRDGTGTNENASDSSPDELLSIGSRDEQLVSAEKPRPTFVKEDIGFRRDGERGEYMPLKPTQDQRLLRKAPGRPIGTQFHPAVSQSLVTVGYGASQHPHVMPSTKTKKQDLYLIPQI